MRKRKPKPTRSPAATALSDQRYRPRVIRSKKSYTRKGRNERPFVCVPRSLFNRVILALGVGEDCLIGCGNAAAKELLTVTKELTRLGRRRT